jgi:hypothetical protein
MARREKHHVQRSRPLSPAVQAAIAALLPTLLLLSQLGVPLYEDSLFWWVPRALLIAEEGPRWIAAGDLPLACLPNVALPPQWTGGLPDYGHPPLWFHYLALWIRLLGPQAWVVHLACVPIAALLGWGTLRLARRMAGARALPLALAALLSPPLLAQLARADTDLPLLAASVWALDALCGRRLGRFAAWSALAVWMKEPGVLLVLPALALAAHRRRLGPALAALAAPVALGAWAAFHLQQTGWALAGAEHLPSGPVAYLRDLGAVLWLVMGASGRWTIGAMLAVTAAMAALNPRAPCAGSPPSTRAEATLLCAVFAASQILFFAGVNFLGGRDTQDAYTHVRYLLPAILTASLLGLAWITRWAARARWLPDRPTWVAWSVATLVVLASLPSARWLHLRGPEANLYGLDQARAWIDAAEVLAARSEQRIWVGSHLYTALTRPYAGLVDEPRGGLHVFGPGTRPVELRPGDLVVHSRYGEPLGRLGELVLETDLVITRGSAWVKLEHVRAGRAASAPSP